MKPKTTELWVCTKCGNIKPPAVNTCCDIPRTLGDWLLPSDPRVYVYINKGTYNSFPKGFKNWEADGWIKPETAFVEWLTKTQWIPRIEIRELTHTFEGKPLKRRWLGKIFWQDNANGYLLAYNRLHSKNVPEFWAGTFSFCKHKTWVNSEDKNLISKTCKKCGTIKITEIK